ncbi:MAG: hypothetical protein D4S01_06450 [Dehalococcoidia bacterium]|nr:MAG: hypothetical protein D4S01_06450 [Dehalococcoidia bacterium]
MVDTPIYIKTLLAPNGKKPAGRRAWGIDLETVWLPFFTATNVMKETAIPADALGAPLRLAYNADGPVRFSKTGRPIMRVAKEIADQVRLVRENFAAGLLTYASGVATDNPEGYKKQVERAQRAGEPIVSRDTKKLSKAISEQVAEAMGEEKQTKELVHATA